VSRKSVTLNATFLTPIFREWIIANGFISANKSTLQRVLQQQQQQQQPSNQQQQSIILVPGGAAEALYTQPGKMALYLHRRQGFVRLAMETNTPLIPCLGFGENDIFDTLVTTKSDTGWKGLVWSLQQAFLKATGISPPIITNPIPRPVTLSVVVGTPLVMDATKSVKENHSRYVQELTQLYDRHAAKVGFGDIPLEIK
jgi:2-acylglycerol O-acyltransferase 2